MKITDRSMIDDDLLRNLYSEIEKDIKVSMMRALLTECFGITDPTVDTARLISERQAAIQALRELCEDHGDNDWPDDLHLADIINKHLER